MRSKFYHNIEHPECNREGLPYIRGVLEKRQPMHLAWPMLSERFLVRTGAVPFMHVKSVFWIAAGEAHHIPIAQHFRHNRGKRDRRNPLVAFYDSPGMRIFAPFPEKKTSIQTNNMVSSK